MSAVDATVLALICGCAGTTLSEGEQRFFAETRPWGLILFRRNVEEPAQVAGLCAAFRAAVGRLEAPVFVDQEGGRVQRLRPPHWPSYPAAALYAAGRSIEDAETAARLGARLVADDLRSIGITADCAPVLDVRAPGSHEVIGDRAFGTDPDTVVRLGRAFAEGLMAGGVLPVVKHMPGHGRAAVDSHHALPVVTADRATLGHVDFEPFRRLADLPAAMTAHLVYTALDPDRPATTSRRIVDEIIRGVLGFDGLLLTDDLSMNALSGSLGERAAAARESGCDILLHCNGVAEEARAVAAEARPVAGDTARRIAAAMARVGLPAPFDRAGARAQLDALMGRSLAA